MSAARHATLPDEAWLVALASLPGVGPVRLSALAGALPPAQAWSAVTNGSVLDFPAVAVHMRPDPAKLARLWRRAAASFDVAAGWAAHAGVTVAAHSSPGYPAALLDDSSPPELVFMAGSTAALDAPKVAVVGTRRCTRYGLDVATEMGRDLALAGVAVVSGLALGIDGAAHRGALDAGPEAAPVVGVVASGLDVPYPRRHSKLWSEVVDRGGLLLSEAPLGTQPEPWRFPARNRIIAGLADVVVVVESPATGGSMYTADAAIERDVTVMAVPGPVRATTSAGTNRLLFDGCTVARDAADVLAFLGLSAATVSRTDTRLRPDADGRRVLRAMGWEATSLEQLALATGLDLGALSVAVTHLEAQGWIEQHGTWLERVGAS